MLVMRPEKVNTPDCSVYAFVFDKIKEYGDEIAIIDHSTDKKIKFSEIQPKAEAIAAGLSERGIKKGDVVTIIALNDPKYIIICYAIMRLGAIINSLSPLSTQNTITQQLKDSNTKIILSNLFTHLQYFDSVVHFDDLIEDDIKKLPDVKISGEDEFLICWTSGTSTGRPKGVVHTHKSILSQYCMFLSNTSNKVKEFNGIRNKDIVPGVVPMSHMFGFYLYPFATILQGACVVIIPKFDFEEFITVLSKYKVTTIHVVPTIINFLVKHPLVESILPLTSLREINSAASHLSENLASAVKKRFDVELRQSYGMIETSCISVPEYGDTRTYSVGKIQPGTEVKVINETGQQVGLGERGEMCVKGLNVMKRWLNDSESCVDEDGFFHTGDIVTYEKDGTITIVDRIKDIIKVKGYQVSPLELENIIINNKKILDVAVIGIEDERKGEVPKAFIVKEKNVNLTKHDVIDFVKGKVESFKNIVDVEFVNTIPKSPMGKILRRELK